LGGESRASKLAIDWLLLAVPNEKDLLAVMLDFAAGFAACFHVVAGDLAVIE